jgi:hypothetical protein
MTNRADNILVALGGCSCPVHQPVAHGVVNPRTYGCQGLGGELGVLWQPYGVSVGGNARANPDARFVR